MAKATVDQIADMAEKACFYVTPDGLWLRMDYCNMDEGTFQCHDEESFEEYCVPFDDITLEGRECFHELTLMTVPIASTERALPRDDLSYLLDDD